MQCVNRYPCPGSPLLHNIILSAQHDAALYSCCTKRLCYFINDSKYRERMYLCNVITHRNHGRVVLTRSIYDLTSLLYFSALILFSGTAFPLHTTTTFKILIQYNQHSIIAIKFPKIRIDSHLGHCKSITFRLIYSCLPLTTCCSHVMTTWQIDMVGGNILCQCMSRSMFVDCEQTAGGSILAQ
jgi:hypothetical protein